MIFFIEVVLSGLMAGVMYSLVALGFVLIFKASGIFNFAQGVMALFAALTLVGLMEKFGMPIWLAIIGTIVVMIALAWAIERFMLRPLVNQEPIILFMATIGLAYVLEGMGDILWGSDVKILDIGIPQGASDWMLDTFDIYIEMEVSYFITHFKEIRQSNYPGIITQDINFSKIGDHRVCRLFAVFEFPHVQFEGNSLMSV